MPDGGRRFTPFLFPEFGWFFVLLSALGVVWAIWGLRGQPKSQRAIGIGLSVVVGLIGAGLILQNKPLTVASAFLSLLPIIMLRRNRNPDGG